MKLLFHPAQACTVGLRNKENLSKLWWWNTDFIRLMTKVFKGTRVDNLFAFIYFHRQNHFAGLSSLFLCKMQFIRAWDSKGAAVLWQGRASFSMAALKQALLAVVWCCLLHFSGAGWLSNGKSDQLVTWYMGGKKQRAVLIGLTMVDSKAKRWLCRPVCNFGMWESAFKVEYAGLLKF